MKQHSDTSWGKVASWYDEYLGADDSYQQQVILPQLLRVVDASAMSGKSLLDLACGQGFFSEQFAKAGMKVTGIDISKELVEKAKARIKSPNVTFKVSPAHQLDLHNDTFDVVVSVLATQNIRELDETFDECARVLKPGGKLVLVINHPAFRIPQQSDWHYDEEKKQQGRVVYQYLSEGSVKIDMNPGNSSTRNKVYTYSFHRPLQVFVKWLTKRGFAITRLEEWTSHKKSQTGPRAKAEDSARKEIPLFMCIEATLQK